MTMVNLDSVGDVTGSKFMGTFKIKCILTHADRFELERLYGEMIPRSLDTVPEDLKNKAATIAQLAVTVVQGPSWWYESRQGRNMADTAPLYDLLILCDKSTKDWLDALKKNSDVVVQGEPGDSE